MNTAKNILITPGSLGVFNTTVSQVDFKWFEAGIGTGIAYPHAADLRATIYNWHSLNEPVLLFGGVGTVNGQSYFIGPYLDYQDVFNGITSFPSIQIFPISGKIITNNLIITGSLYDSINSIGLAGSILASLGTGIIWVPPVFNEGTNIFGSFSTNQVLYGVGTGIGGSNNLIFTGSNLGIGTSNPLQTLSIWGTTFMGNGVAISCINNSIFDASTLTIPGQGFIGVYHYETLWQGNGIAFNSQILGNKVLGMIVNADTMYFGSATDNIDFLTLNNSQANFLDNNSYNVFSINSLQGTTIQNSNTDDQKALYISKNDVLTTSSENFVGISTITLLPNCMLTIEGIVNGWASTTLNEAGRFMAVFYNNGLGVIQVGGSTDIFSKFTGSGGNFEVLGIGNTVYVVVKATLGTSWVWRSNYKCFISQNE